MECIDKDEMSSDVLRNVQLKGLNLLLVLDDFCKRNDLLYYLCGGCCIGAIRHKGFIPWDDDVDVMMPRKDLEKLILLWNDQMGHTQYRLNDNSLGSYLRTMWVSISDENTTFIKERQADLDISHGIRLEIIPLDGCPDSRIARVIQMFWALVHQMYIMQEPPESKGKIFSVLGRLLLGICRTWKKRYHIAKYAEKQMSKYSFDETRKVTELTTRFRYMRNEYPKSAFEASCRVEFEGHQVPVPIGYDTYLRMAFGNYMELPPEEARKPRHETVFIDTSKSYKQYKGIYYCIDSRKVQGQTRHAKSSMH